LTGTPVMALLPVMGAACRKSEEHAGSTASAAPPPTARPRVSRDVVLITIDTLRYDATSFDGNPRGTTPNLDRFAAEGRVFRAAHSHNVITLPSHSNILTGMFPYQHGVRENAGFRLSPHTPTVATRLKARGYVTGAFVGAFVLDGRFGLNQGFDVYDDHLARGNAASFHFAERRAADVVKLAGDWILNRQSTNSQSPINQQSAISSQQSPYGSR